MAGALDRRIVHDLLARGHVADHRASVLARPLEADERRAEVHDVARASEELLDLARPRRGNLDHRLRGLDGDERLVGLDVVAGGDVPLDDLGLLQSFAQVGQLECFHQVHSRAV